MPVFPETTQRRPLYGYDPTPAQNVKETPPEAGNSFFRDVWGGLRFMAQMEFDLSIDDFVVLWSFYLTNRFSSFTFFDFAEEERLDTFTGNGVLTTFTLRGKETRNYTVTGGGAYTISAGTGAEGEDRIIFTVAPPAGPVTVRWTGRRRFLCEFSGQPNHRLTRYKRKFVSMVVRERFPLAV